MDAPNQFTRATVMAGQTVRRLERKGLPIDEAKRLVAGLIKEEESKYMKGKAFDEKGFIERLRRLPKTNAA